jgi:hypothetical protein
MNKSAIRSPRIGNQVAQIQQGIKNLQYYGSNYGPTLIGYANQLSQKLGQAQQIGYQLNTSVAQLNTLYPRITASMTNPQTLATLQAQWAGLLREAAQTGVQVQSIQSQTQQLLTQISAVMTDASRTQGNLDVQQTAVQMQGLLGTQIAGVEGQMAAGNRIIAIQAMQQAAMDEAKLQAIQQATGTAMASYAGGQGKLPCFAPPCP